MADFGAVFMEEQPESFEPSLELSVEVYSEAPDPVVSATWFYYMRAWNTNLSSFVYWRVPNNPDFTGSFSGYPIVDIQDAIVMTSEVST